MVYSSVLQWNVQLKMAPASTLSRIGSSPDQPDCANSAHARQKLTATRPAALTRCPLRALPSHDALFSRLFLPPALAAHHHHHDGDDDDGQDGEDDAGNRTDAILCGSRGREQDFDCNNPPHHPLELSILD